MGWQLICLKLERIWQIIFCRHGGNRHFGIFYSSIESHPAIICRRQQGATPVFFHTYAFAALKLSLHSSLLQSEIYTNVCKTGALTSRGVKNAAILKLGDA